MIENMMIGPGQPCMHCGEGYGQHTKHCLVGKNEDRERQAIAKREADRQVLLQDLRDFIDDPKDVANAVVTLAKLAVANEQRREDEAKKRSRR